MNEQMFDRDLRLEMEHHKGEGRIYYAYTYDTLGAGNPYIKIYLASRLGENGYPCPYWTTIPKKRYKTSIVEFLGALVKDLLKRTDFKEVYIAEIDNGLITCLDNPRLNKKKGGNNDQQ